MDGPVRPNRPQIDWIDVNSGKKYVFVFVMLIPFLGCNSIPSQHRTEVAMSSSSANPILYGGRQPGLDAIESAIHAPRQFVARALGDLDSGSLPPESEQIQALELSRDYLQKNGLQDVHIDVRRYAPREQWRRIRENERISPALKYSAGTLSWVGYTLFPGRVFHTDEYDVFSNSLALNSGEPASSLYAAAEAMEYRKRRMPGVYWGIQSLPGIPVVHHLTVGTNAAAYAREIGDEKLTNEVRKHSLTEAIAELATEMVDF